VALAISFLLGLFNGLVMDWLFSLPMKLAPKITPKTEGGNI
jgi:hypothetical protein